jgi:DNA-binding transcriptional MerR regulator
VFRIGEFAKMGCVSVKTLHHYDEVGLLRPAEVNVSTSYRYYTIDQLSRLNRILALKDLGFSLEQIRAALNENLTPLEMREMLHLQQERLQKRVEEEQARLERVEVRLQLIEQERTRPVYDIVLKPVEPLLIATTRAVLPLSSETPLQCAQLAQVVMVQLIRSGLESSGPWHAIYHDSTNTSQDNTIDVEIGVGVARTRQSEAVRSRQHEQVIIRELAGSATTACLLHTGNYDGLWNAYIAIMEWVSASGYHGVEPYRCVYLRMPEEGYPLTELQLPVERNA